MTKSIDRKQFKIFLYVIFSFGAFAWVLFLSSHDNGFYLIAALAGTVLGVTAIGCLISQKLFNYLHQNF